MTLGTLPRIALPALAVLAAAPGRASHRASPGEEAGAAAPGLPYALPAERRTVWQPGVTYNGGIPSASWPVCRTLSPSGGDDTRAIQSALDRCPPRQVVKLAPGDFHVTDTGLAITRSYVVLRGSGLGATRLSQARNGGYPVIVVGQRWYKWMDQRPLLSSAVKGANRVRVAKAQGLSVGEIVHLSETYDPSLTWYSGNQQNDYLGWGEGRKGHPADSRPVGQAMEIAAIDGDEVTFTTPFHIGLRTSHAAHLARIGDGERLVPAVKWSGIEDLTVAYGGGGDGGGNVRFFATAYCWARNIESRKSGGSAFAFDGSFRSELRDSYCHSTANPNPGGGGYGIAFDAYSADCLVENSISWNFNKVMVMRSSGGGNVIAYNYMEDAYGAGYPTILETGLNASHMTTPHYELFEGNQSFNADSDSTWGNSIYITFFRNHLTTLRRSLGAGTSDGVAVPLTDLMNRRGIGLTVHHWWYSFVANVIGYPDGYLQYPSPFSPAPGSSHFIYEWTGAWGKGTPMWQIGYDGGRWGTTPDARVVETTIRDGNYDYFTHSVHWHNSPPAPLPPSFYLAAKPPFFGSNPWPWVEPLTGTVHTLPARERFDRELFPREE